jgi:hypothetical protein
VVLELNRLLGTRLPCEDESLPAVERRLDETSAPTRALLAHLSPRRGGIAGALDEILFVPRLRRIEYVDNPTGRPPWKIQRLLLEYAVWSLRIDEVLGALTKGYCATSCDRLPAGCCTVLGYDLGLVPGAMLRAQELEARLRGWTGRDEAEPRRPSLQETCRYHGPEGCCLRRFKSPACAGMLCEALEEDLRRRFAPGPLEAFLAPLARFRTHALDRAAIFAVMEQVVVAGRLLAAQSAKTCVQ